MKKYNFSAGPAILPQEVFQQAAQGVLDIHQSGLSILEISHRSKEFQAVIDEAEVLLRDLLGLSEDFAVLFLTGGASSQFFMAPMNLLNPDQTAAYVDTGSWSSKAIKEARNFGKVEVVASSKAEGYTHIPKGYKVPSDARYLHLTSNNTIFGTQYKAFPKTKVPMVCDMSSDFLSRPLDVAPFGLIYAGAQKNVGPAGLTLVIIRKDLVGQVERTIPTMLNYQTHIDKGSMFNTPPVFPIFVSMLTMRWIKAMGGLEAMDRHNAEKAEKIYSEIDRNPLFRGTAAVEDRSAMNACFVMEKEYESLEGEFLQLCTENNIVGLKGHRSVGGFRASIYNAMSQEGADVLVQVMQAFARQKA